nr:MAG TPA: hypothetical protein [Caudoviricetes sp.]
MDDKDGGVTKKTQNRDKTPATLHVCAVINRCFHDVSFYKKRGGNTDCHSSPYITLNNLCKII